MRGAIGTHGRDPARRRLAMLAPCSPPPPSPTLSTARSSSPGSPLPTPGPRSRSVVCSVRTGSAMARGSCSGTRSGVCTRSACASRSTSSSSTGACASCVSSRTSRPDGSSCVRARPASWSSPRVLPRAAESCAVGASHSCRAVASRGLSAVKRRMGGRDSAGSPQRCDEPGRRGHESPIRVLRSPAPPAYGGGAVPLRDPHPARSGATGGTTTKKERGDGRQPARSG